MPSGLSVGSSTGASSPDVHNTHECAPSAIPVGDSVQPSTQTTRSTQTSVNSAISATQASPFNTGGVYRTASAASDSFKTRAFLLL